MSDKKKKFKPYIAHHETLPEFTWIAIVVGILINIVLTAANTYLGLKIGMTVSASIPAAVISMGILRGLMKRKSILENNIVQTMASAGEAVAAGVIFTIPALYILKLKFHLLDTMLWAALGGLLGVLFMIPLRRFLIVEEADKLPYPEGTACAQVLIAGEEGKEGVTLLFTSFIIASIYRASQVFFHWIKEEVEWHIPSYKTLIGGDIYPALLGVGYIVGINIALVMLSGGLLSWLVLIPLIKFAGGSQLASLDAWTIWDKYIRYIGAGVVAAGGLISLLEALPTILNSFIIVIKEFKLNVEEKLRTEKDLSSKVIILGSLIAIILIYLAVPVHDFIGKIISSFAVIIFGFFFVTVSARIVGLVGSSNQPVSGMTIGALLGTAIVAKFMGISGKEGMLITLVVGGIICIALAAAGDMSQDLKTGYLVGATPYLQQIAQFIGIILGVIIAVQLLPIFDKAYQFGSRNLPAPQANLMAMITDGIFKGNIPWELIFIGIAIGIMAKLVKIPVLVFGVGVYLPVHLSTPIVIGGFVRYITDKFKYKDENHKEDITNKGILISSGLIAGDAITGLVYAFLVALGIIIPKSHPHYLFSNSISTLFYIALSIFLYYIIKKLYRESIKKSNTEKPSS